MSDREHLNCHLGDALNSIEKALSSDQNKRNRFLEEALEAIEFVKREEAER